jgi:lysophospholipase L1-like esterase
MWLGAWEAAPQIIDEGDLPKAPALAGSTLRQVLRVTAGGGRWRVRISNEFGDGPLTIESAHIAKTVRGDAIDPSTDSPLTFGGQTSITLAAGSAMESDVVAKDVAALSRLTVSLQVRQAPSRITGHSGSQTTSFVIAGDHVRDPALPGASRVEHWYFLTGVTVQSTEASGAVVVLGNSIADGHGSALDKDDRWTDHFANRLRGDMRTSNVAVLNAGIEGNAVVRGGLGPTAIERFSRDVLAQPGVRWVIVSEGVNDIGASSNEDADDVAGDVIKAYQSFIMQAHQRGIRVYGATILPFGGSDYGSIEHENARRRVNEWIRGGGALDGVIDFDAAMRSSDPTRLRGDADSGDHLHPNELGHRVMADAINLSLFVRER